MKITDDLVGNDKIGDLRKCIIWGKLYYTVTLTASQYLKTIFILWRLYTFILWYEIGQYLEDLNYSMNQYPPSDQCMMLYNHAWVQKLYCYIFRLHIETNFKKLSLVRVWWNIKTNILIIWKDFKNTPLFFPLRVYVVRLSSCTSQ